MDQDEITFDDIVDTKTAKEIRLKYSCQGWEVIIKETDDPDRWHVTVKPTDIIYGWE